MVYLSQRAEWETDGMRERRSSVITVLIFGFLFICLFFPGDPYHIKLIFFLTVCIYGIGILINQAREGRYGWIYIMGILYPAAIIIWSAIMTGDAVSAVSGGYPAVLILLVILINEGHVPYEKMLMVLLQVMVLATLALIVLDLTGVSSVNGSNPIRNAFYGYDMGLMGKSPEYAAYYKVFFKASPLMLLLIPYCFRNKKYIMACLTLLALFFSGTRANILMAAVVFFVGFIDIWSERNGDYKKRLLIFILAVAVVALTIPIAFNMIGSMMRTTGSVASDAVRSGQMESFGVVFSRPLQFLFGMGFGSVFFDIGRMSYSASSEISYLDMIRKTGFVLFIPLLLFILRPFQWKIEGHIKIAYFAYLLSAFTNPLLFSSTAYVLYIYLYGKEYQNRTEEQSFFCRKRGME